MLFPEDKSKRSRLIDGARTAKTDKLVDLRPQIMRGKFAGAILLRACELSKADGGVSFRAVADKITDDLATDIRRVEDALRDDFKVQVRGQRSRDALTRAWRSHRHVAHFWAVVLRLNGQWPRDEAELVEFAFQAEAFAVKGRTIRWRGDTAAPVVDSERAWRVKLPRM